MGWGHLVENMLRFYHNGNQSSRHSDTAKGLNNEKD